MADDTDREIAELKARLAALEQKPITPAPAVNQFSHFPSYHDPRARSKPTGWVAAGSIALALAVTVAFAALINNAQLQPTKSASTSIDPSSYTALCAVALTKVQFATHEIEGASLTPNDPAVIQAGPPMRLQCGIAEGTYVGAVTFDALCDDWQNSGCVKPTAAVMDGRVIYVSPEARAALEKAAGPRRRRHHE